MTDKRTTIKTAAAALENIVREDDPQKVMAALFRIAHTVQEVASDISAYLAEDRKARCFDAPGARADSRDTSEVGENGQCRRCAGTGQFVTMVVNGVPKGPGGICFRCNGTGVQTRADVRRNDYHDAHYCPPGMGA